MDNNTDTDQLTNRHEQLQAEIKEYLAERDRIRDIVGQLGGKPTRKEVVINTVFLILVAGFFVASIVTDPRSLPLEIAILLVSLKLVIVVTQNARLDHSQFWMLSTIEWRLNEIHKKVRELEKRVKTE